MDSAPITRRVLARFVRWCEQDPAARRFLEADLSEPERRALRRLEANLRAAGPAYDWFHWSFNAGARIKHPVLEQLLAGLYLPDDLTGQFVRACRLCGDGVPLHANFVLEQAINGSEAAICECKTKTPRQRVRSGNEVRSRIEQWLIGHGYQVREIIPTSAKRTMQSELGMNWNTLLSHLTILRRERGALVGRDWSRRR